MSTPKLPIRNRVLAALPGKEYAHLSSQLEPVELLQGEILFEPDDPISHVYFINEGMASLVAIMKEGQSIEVGVIGKEGAVGFQAVFGADRMQHRVLVQMSGAASRMKAGGFKEEVNRLGVLQNLLMRYNYAMLTQITQLPNRHENDNRINSTPYCIKLRLVSYIKIPSEQT